MILANFIQYNKIYLQYLGSGIPVKFNKSLSLKKSYICYKNGSLNDRVINRAERKVITIELT